MTGIEASGGKPGDSLPEGIAEAARRLREGDCTAESLTAACLTRIAAAQPQLNAFITVTAEAALAQARNLDAELRAGKDRGLLHGIPIVHKDLYATAGVATSFGSEVLRHQVPTRDAAVVRRLRDAGAVMLGKTGMNEFAAGITGSNEFHGDVRNPWDPARSPGGSSSGTAAAVAAGLALAGTGSDTGGSIRAPACWTGLTGLRPSHGLVSLAGAHARSASLDCGGPLARSAEDCAILLQAMAGPDPEDPRTAGVVPGDYVDALRQGVAGLRLGLVSGYGEHGLDEDVARGLQEAVGIYRQLGVKVWTLRIPLLEGTIDLGAVFDLLLYEFHQAWAATWQATADKARFGRIVREDFARGSRITADSCVAAQHACASLREGFKEALKQVDALLIPAMPNTAPLLASGGADYDRGRPFLMPVSATGLPALATPTGLDRRGLPMGMQLVGRRYAEATLLRLAHAHQLASGHHRLRPPSH